jgi:hypothetical protein
MGSNDRDQIVALEEARYGFLAVEVRAPAGLVDSERSFADAVIVLDGVSPDDIAEDAYLGRLDETVDEVDVLAHHHFRANTSMKRNELPVHDASKRHVVKGVHDDIVDFLVVLVAHLLVEVEIGCKLTALVVAA